MGAKQHRPARVRISLKVPVKRSVQSGLVRLRRVRRHVRSAHLPPWLRLALARSRQNPAEGLSPEAALYARRNFRLGVANGIIYGLADSLIAPSFVLALFVNRLGAPNVLVGLIPAILSGGGLLPQLLVATRVQGQPRVMHWYRRTSFVRASALALLTLSTFLLAGSPGLLLAAFFVFYSFYAFGAGISGIPWLEVVSKTIAPRRRGTFFSVRSFWGGVLALLASGIVAGVLSEKFSGLQFPYNFALIFAIETVLVSVALTLMSLVHEPPATVSAEPVTLRSIFGHGFAAVKTDTDYRSFMIARVLLALATIADPFYVVFARTQLGAPNDYVGLYLAASSASILLSNFLWGPLGDRASNRVLMTLTVLTVASVPLSALVVPTLGGVLGRDGVFTAFSLVFVLGGLAAGSGRILNNNMLLAIAPPAKRATYIGFLNTLLGVVTFVPPFGGALVDAFGFAALFVVTLLIAGSAIVASLKMSTRRVFEQA